MRTVQPALVLQETHLSLRAVDMICEHARAKGENRAHLFVTAYEANDNGLFLSSLHPVHGADL